MGTMSSSSHQIKNSLQRTLHQRIKRGNSQCFLFRPISIRKLILRKRFSSENEEKRYKISELLLVLFSKKSSGKKYFSHSESKSIKTGEKTRKPLRDCFLRNKNGKRSYFLNHQFLTISHWNNSILERCTQMKNRTTFILDISMGNFNMI